MYRYYRPALVVMFSGEDPELRLSDWLPSLMKAVQWNGWGSEELLIQLAGYLKGRALQEWNLLEEAERDSYDKTVVALRSCLDAALLLVPVAGGPQVWSNGESCSVLCIAAKSEKHRQAALKKRKQNQGDHLPSFRGPSRPSSHLGQEV